MKKKAQILKDHFDGSPSPESEILLAQISSALQSQGYRAPFVIKNAKLQKEANPLMALGFLGKAVMAAIARAAPILGRIAVYVGVNLGKLSLIVAKVVGSFLLKSAAYGAVKGSVLAINVVNAIIEELDAEVPEDDKKELEGAIQDILDDPKVQEEAEKLSNKGADTEQLVAAYNKSLIKLAKNKESYQTEPLSVISEEGLWENIRKKKKHGEIPAKPGDDDYPESDAWDKARGKTASMAKESAKYKGKEVELNKPMRGSVKKYQVYVKNDKGNIVKVNFGDPNMEIRRDDPERRKNFRARHNCDEKKDKTSPGYWSCKMWSKKSVSDILDD